MIELNQIKEYITSEKSEKANDHLIFPLFKKIFGNKDFNKESEASGADIYINGRLIVELKTNFDDWVEGFFQAFHYQKKGLSFLSICVISHNFIGLWKIKDLPSYIFEIAQKSDPIKAPNEIGKSNSKRINKGQQNELLSKAIFSFTKNEIDSLMCDTYLLEFADYLKNLDFTRQQINPQNFINKIVLLENYFDKPMDAVHCFYAIVGYWDITSVVVDPNESNPEEIWISCQNGRKNSERFIVNPKKQIDFRKFVENHYIFTNHEEGLTVDYYFSRFDEVITRLNPEYTRQHGIYFTDINLSKFALWFVRDKYEKKLSENYIVLDPAGGSGNLVTSWRGHLKHKIVSELQPDLLKTIERRMKEDPDHVQMGFTIVPKTSENQGLNFINQSAESYINQLEKAIKEKNLYFDKPIAFLLNPPYKNTDENENMRNETDSSYDLDNSILELTGSDAGKERYLAFLAQIINISKLQVQKSPDFNPILMIFTPTSWLIPRPTYINFREKFDKFFKYEIGFIVNGNEFFKGVGKFPISFTIWKYNYNEKGNKNIIALKDFTHLIKNDLAQINWHLTVDEINKIITKIIRGSNNLLFINRGDIRESLPVIKNNNKENLEQQPRYDYSTAKREKDYKKIVSGFPLKDENRHYILKRKCGDPKGVFIGFYDDNTPVRIKQDNYNRMTNKPDRVWFRLDNVFININQTRLLNGAPDKYGFCAYNINSAKVTFSWFALTKVFVGNYPMWANQYDIWPVNISPDKEKYFYSLCFAFGLSENRCVITKFEKDNPVQDAPEIYVDNPMSTNNSDSFWMKVLDKEIIDKPSLAKELVDLIKELYKFWNVNFCKGQIIENVGLNEEPYFKYFNYPDFLTKDSGLIQIKKYAEIRSLNELSDRFKKISEVTKKVKEEIYKLLVEDFKYFE